jgi:predicted Fe-Mo cluster-binding NifX family protein
MVIAVAAKSHDPESEVDSRFCTANCFHLVNTGTHEIEVIDNISARGPVQKVETRAAGLIMEKGADMVLAGLCGPKAYECLCAARIRLVADIHGTVKDVVKSFEYEVEQDGVMDEDECPICLEAESWWNWK